LERRLKNTAFQKFLELSDWLPFYQDIFMYFFLRLVEAVGMNPEPLEYLASMPTINKTMLRQLYNLTVHISLVPSCALPQ
jgi:hypothetical protein